MNVIDSGDMFGSAFIWFVMQPSVALMTIGGITILAIFISLIFVIRKWGEYV